MEQSELLRIIVEAMRQLGARYLVTGSQASIYFGEPRFTNDIDIVADLRVEHVEPLCRLFPEPDFYVSPEAVRDAITHCTPFNIIHPQSGIWVFT